LPRRSKSFQTFPCFASLISSFSFHLFTASICQRVLIYPIVPTITLFRHRISAYLLGVHLPGKTALAQAENLGCPSMVQRSTQRFHPSWPTGHRFFPKGPESMDGKAHSLSNRVRSRNGKIVRLGGFQGSFVLKTLQDCDYGSFYVATGMGTSAALLRRI
jgi:hypothetical protein